MNRILVCLWVSCVGAAMRATAAQPPADPNSQRFAVVARVGDFAITRDDLSRRLAQEMQPRDEQFYQPGEPVTVLGTLRTLIAEKAMSMEGRRLGYLSDEHIHAAVVQEEQQRLVIRLLETELGGKEVVEEAEIDRVMKENPKATREQAKMIAQRSKMLRLREEFVGQIAQKRKLTKRSENIAKTAELHRRLLSQPRQPRGPGEYWIRNSQINSDLSDEERSLVLAVYEGGQYTVKDWFAVLCNFAPPRRPKDLDTPQGVEKLLDGTLWIPMLTVEAKSRGYDQDPRLRSDIKMLEDRRLQYKVQEEATQGIAEPAPEQIKDQIEKHPEKYASSPALKADQIWFEEEAVAQKVKKMLDEGADFAALKADHSLQKDVGVHALLPGSEGVFWADLWKGEPNQVVGPVRGFYSGGLKWRLVKIQEKTPAQAQPYSEQLASSVKWAIMGEQRQQRLNALEKSMLEKYPYEIYSDKIRDLDPLEAAAERRDR